jgi:nitrogen regulatory protein P-II 1
MTKIEAVIKAVDLERLVDCLNKTGFQGMTISEVKCFGKMEGHARIFDAIDFVPRLKIEIIASDNRVEEVIRVIEENANTNMKGNTMIFVSTIENIIRIRTGEKAIE